MARAPMLGLSLGVLSCGGADPLPSPPPVREVAILPAASAAPAPSAPPPGPPPAPKAVPVELYVMSQCPYGTPVETTLKTLRDRLPNIDLRVDFIGTAAPDGTLGSMHGPNELAGDLIQICAMKHTPNWLELIACQNRNIKEVHENWRVCGEALGIATAPIEACAQGSEGRELLAASFARSTAAGARGSPTIVIAGQTARGERTIFALGKAVCDASGEPKPPFCVALASAPEVAVTWLTDTRCTDCPSMRDSQRLLDQLTKPKLQQLAYGTAEGRGLYETIKPERLPVLLFDGSLANDEPAQSFFLPKLRDKGSFKALTLGHWNPACADAGGCQLAECKADLFCARELPNRVELVMRPGDAFSSHAVLALRELVQTFQVKASRVDVALTFPGGDARTIDARRQLCVSKHYGTKHKDLDYAACRAKSPEGDFAQCLDKAQGFDADKIRTCAAGEEGARLHARSMARTRELGVVEAPLFILNGKKRLSATRLDPLRQAFCDMNAKTPACRTP